MINIPARFYQNKLAYITILMVVFIARPIVVQAYRCVSNDATLSALSLSNGSLSPSFSSSTTSYIASETNGTGSITVTPTVNQANATVKVNGTTVTSGNLSSSITLSVGSNTINIVVTAQDGATTKTYNVVVIRAAIPPGNCLNFNGSNNTVGLGTSLGNFGTSDFTIECYVLTTYTGPNYMTLFSKRGYCGHISFLNCYLTASGYPGFELDQDVNGTNYIWVNASTNPVNDGRWHNVAFVRSGSSIKIYVDGVVTASSTTSGTASISNTTAFTIGGGSPCSQYSTFLGSMDEVRVWNVARTQGQIQNNMLNVVSPSTSGLTAYYNFDDGVASGTNTTYTTLYDQTTNGYNGTLNSFSLSGSTSNWEESYAMVVPSPNAATNILGTGFTANWWAPAIGTVSNYYLDVSTSSTFSSFVSGYNGLSVSGTSQAVTGLSGGTTYYYRVRANKTSVSGQGDTSATITATTLSNNANLASFTVSTGNSLPTFASAATTYTTTVPITTTSVSVTATVSQTNATLTINGTSVVSGTASGAISLNVGSNTITVIVTAQDGTTTKTYSMVVIRASAAPYNCLNFNGNNNYIDMGTSLGNFGTSDYTIETDILTTYTSGNYLTLFSKRFYCGQGSFINIYLTPTGYVGMEVDNDASGSNYKNFSTSSSPINDGKWHHLAFVRSGTNMIIYVDGVSTATATTSITYNISNNVSFYIAGGSPCNAQNNSPSIYNTFIGSMDEVRIWSVARTQAQIAANMYSPISPSSTGLTAYYNFDEGIAAGNNTLYTTLFDQTTNAYNGTIYNVNLTGSTSNFIESYAMVAPTLSAATAITSSGFTANWNVPAIGVVDNGYRLDVSTSSTFSTFVTGYNGLSVSGTSKAVTGLNAGTTYYYRVRADKTSVTGEGGNYFSITATTFSTDATLSALSLSSGTLSPTFASATTSYSASVGNTISSITLTPTVHQANATVTVNGSATTSGTASTAISLNVGTNTINVVVTAQDMITTKTYTITLTRACPTITASIQGTATTCAGSSTNLSVLVSGGVSPYSITYSGNVVNNYVSANPISVSPTVSTTYTLSSVNDANNCAASITTTNVNITVLPLGTWQGTYGTIWDTTRNWCGNAVPTITTDVTIPSGVSNYPLILGTSQVNNLTVASGAMLNVTGVLQVAGTITNNGTINDTTGALSLNGSSQQTLGNLFSNGNTLGSLIVNNPAGVVLTNALNIKNFLQITSGSLYLCNSDITLKSNASTTAEIGVLNGSNPIIYNGTGRFVAERYLNSMRRGYRNISSGGILSDSSIFYNWQENGCSPIGYGTQITGKVGLKATYDSVTGLDYTRTGNYSLFTYNNSDAFVAVSITKTPSNYGLVPFVGYYALIRGDRTYDLFTNGPSLNVASTTLRVRGKACIGTVTLSSNASPLWGFSSLGAPNFKLNSNTTPQGGSPSNYGYTLLANPYPCATNWNSVYNRSNGSTYSNGHLSPYMWIWNQTYNNGIGGWITIDNAGNKNSTQVNNTQYIQPGQSFFVHNDNSGSPLKIEFQEGDKWTTDATQIKLVFGQSPDPLPSFLRMRLLRGDSLASTVADESLESFSSLYSNQIDMNDAPKFDNPGENLTINRAGTALSIEKRNIPIPNDSTPIKLNNLTKDSSYVLQVDATGFDGFAQVYLKDKYLNCQYKVPSNGMFTYPFVFNINDTNSYLNRFVVVFGNPTVLPLGSISLHGFSKGNKNKLNWTVAEKVGGIFAVERSLDGIRYTTIGYVDAKSVNAGGYQFEDNQTNDSWYRVTLSLGGEDKVSPCVYLPGQQENGPTVRMLGNIIGNGKGILSFFGVGMGIYDIDLVGMNGTTIWKTTIDHRGGDATYSLLAATQRLVTGVYVLRVGSKGGWLLEKKCIVGR